MFSWEIDKLVRRYNGRLPSSVYLEISDIRKNTQIDNIKYDAWSNSFNIWTKDGYSWLLSVYKE